MDFQTVTFLGKKIIRSINIVKWINIRFTVCS